jgi:RNA polymerase sigma factor (sigma-70 family)
MTTGPINRVLGQLRRAGGQSRSDGELLTGFVERREECAFEALVRRHGPMVFGVCRRLLRHAQDAEDAFQATFLVLARRAAVVQPREAVGDWLFGVAHRTALEARRRIARRRTRETQVDSLPETPVELPDTPLDLLPLLDTEISRLPEKYRLPVILCELQGRSRKEVASQLRIPEGTLSSRLAAARKMLAARLTRRGVSLAGAALGWGLTAAAPAVPPLLVASTTRAAVQAAVSANVNALTEGVLRMFFIAKLKTVTAVVFVAAAFGLGTGGLVYQTRVVAADPEQPSRARANAAEPRDAEEALRKELAKVRQDLEVMRAEAEKQRQRAEEALKKLEAQLAQAKEAEEASRRQAEKVLYAARVQQAQADFAAAAKAGAPAKDTSAAKRQSNYEQRRQALLNELKELEAQHQKDLAEAQPKQAQPSGDKLDRILEQLERLEKRLERLERGAKEEGRSKSGLRSF